MVTRATRIVVIGYSFNPRDRASYAPLVEASVGYRLLLVTPEAPRLVKRLTQEYPTIHWEGAALSFKDWVRHGYPGLAARENIV